MQRFDRLLASSCVLAATTIAHAQLQLDWMKNWGDQQFGEKAVDIALDPSDNIIVAGSQQHQWYGPGSTPYNVGHVWRFGPSGLPAGSYTYVGWVLEDDYEVEAVAADSEYMYYAVTEPSPVFVTVLEKRSLSGELVWNRTIEYWIFSSYDIDLDTQSNIYLCGRSNSTGSSGQLARYDTNGNEVWRKEFGTSEGTSSNRIRVDNAAGIYVCGSTYGDLGSASMGMSDAYLARLTENGEPIWFQQLGTPEHDAFTAIDIAPDSSLVVAGNTFGSLARPSAGQGDVIVVKYNATGTMLWTVQHGTAANETSTDVKVDPEGSVYVLTDSFDVLSVEKYSSIGDQLWKYDLPGIAGNSRMVLDSNQNVLISGTAFGTFSGTAMGGLNAFLLKLNQSCYPDCNGSGSLNIFDYICFGNAFGAGEPYADCDGNGSLNTFDYICFGNAYTVGCP
ncbi:MAG: hypothetical protein H6815_04620 [Phycisphaeraceae bacterium]|nr:hypothetical protein [Phycisphaerales bacterium]MCB9859717.1 hypothetical protein [Phycisphaeraceae bacterium]